GLSCATPACAKHHPMPPATKTPHIVSRFIDAFLNAHAELAPGYHVRLRYEGKICTSEVFPRNGDAPALLCMASAIHKGLRIALSMRGYHKRPLHGQGPFVCGLLCHAILQSWYSRVPSLLIPTKA